LKLKEENDIMTNQEMIKKFKLTVGFGMIPGSKTPQKGLKVKIGKPSAKEIEFIKAHKPEIIAELEAEEARKIAEEKVAKEAQIASIKNGDVKIKPWYHDGEYLSGYSICGLEAELLKELKLVKDVSGWGYLVDDDLIKTCGKEFTYAQAAEFAKPKLEAMAAKKAAKEAALAAKFEEAKRTGKSIEITHWAADCNDPEEDCNTDIVTEWAMPDGSIKTTRQHTW
jgi:hypothetical protein